MEPQEQQYQNGVNSGYFLAEHEPELASIIMEAARPASERNEYAFGLSHGYNLYESERRAKEQGKESAIQPQKESRALPEQPSPEQIYIKGFNSGYLLSKHEPELAQWFASAQPTENEFYRGMTAGSQQYETELREWTNSFNRGGPARDDRDFGMER